MLTNKNIKRLLTNLFFSKGHIYDNNDFKFRKTVSNNKSFIKRKV